jgi:hypothetical protein
LPWLVKKFQSGVEKSPIDFGLLHAQQWVLERVRVRRLARRRLVSEGRWVAGQAPGGDRLLSSKGLGD